MNFYHSPTLINLYPNNYTGLIYVKDFSDYSLISKNLEYFRNDLIDTDFISEVQSTADKWKEIFIKMGAKPRYKSSLGALLERFISERKLYRINPIVDLYNYYSLIKGFPMGAYDAWKIAGNIHLDIVEKGKDFMPLGNPKAIEKTKNNEVTYSDDEKIMCRYWNLQDCDQTKITETTKNIIFIFDLIGDNSNSVKEQFSNIVRDFTSFFCQYGEKLEFSGITGKGLSEKMEF